MPGFTSAAAAAKDVQITASNALLKESTGEESVTGTTYTIAKSIGIPSNRVRKTIRITFTLKATVAAKDSFGQLQMNGANVGSEQVATTDSYVTKSQDIDIQGTGGRLDLLIHGEFGATVARTDNLSIKGDETEHDQEYEVIL